MKNKQTAVEWLVEKLMKAEFINNPNELIEQAKQMEKQQIKEAAVSNGNITGEQYYNETFKTKQCQKQNP